MRAWWAAAVLCAGCNAVLGIEQLPPGTQSDAAPAVVFDYLEPGCASCVAASCAAEEEVCRGAPDCAGLYQCLVRCPLDDPACRAACAAASGAAPPATYEALDACRRRSCVDGCYGIGHLLDWLGADCAQCLERECRDALVACVQSGTGPDGGAGEVGRCERIQRCRSLSSPPNPAQTVECIFGSMRKSENDDAMNCAMMSTCAASVCQIGTDNRCLGAYEWPKTTETTFASDLTFQTALPTAPAADLNVDVCPFWPCTPASTATTDAAGHVQLTLPATSVNGFVGVLSVTADPARLDPIPPHLLSFGRPIRFHEMHTYGLLTSSVMSAFLAQLGLQLEPGRGVVSLVSFDCNYLPAVGVVVDPLGVGETIIYLRGGLPMLTATSTDNSGGAVILNVPAGNAVVITTHLAASGDSLATLQIPVVDQTITETFAFPATR